MLFFVLFVPFVPFVALLLDRDPNTVGAAVEQCRSEQPRALAVIAKAFRVQVEVPVAVSQPELIAGCGRVGWRCIDRRRGRRCITVLDRLQRMNARGQRLSEAHRVELHWNRAVQLERPDRVRKAAASA